MPKIIFVAKNGKEIEVEANCGQSLLEIAHEHEIDIEGACGGALACSTCHVIVSPSWFDHLPKATEDEEDMLDLAFSPTPTSRLCCQIIVSEQLDGLRVTLPPATRNLTS